MSLFVGPIHAWLWGKICAQEELTQELTAHFGQDRAALDSLGTISFEPLVEQIDTTNIHGWLQEHIRIAEARYATAVSNLLESGHSIEALKEQVELIGLKQAEESTPTELEDGKAALQTLDTYTLNGMPCDGVLAVQELGEDHAAFVLSEEIHAKHIEPMLAPALYYELRLCWTRGIMGAYGWEIEEISPATYLLRRA